MLLFLMLDSSTAEAVIFSGADLGLIPYNAAFTVPLCSAAFAVMHSQC